MKKMLMLVLILALSSMASAVLLNLTWSADSVTLNNVGDTITVQISAPTNGNYDDTWVGIDTGNAAGVDTIVEILNNAGDSETLRDPVSTEFPGWWIVAAADMTEPFDSIKSGNQWDVTIKGLSAGTCDIEVQGDTTDYLHVTVIPEPVTIALLGLGSLLLRRRR